jgi:hypothetical protein
MYLKAKRWLVFFAGNDTKGRRTMHEYYARGGYLEVPADPDGEWEAHVRTPTPLLTDWVKIPEVRETKRNARPFF